MDRSVLNAGLLCRRMRPVDLDLVLRNENLSSLNPWSRRIFQDCLRAGYECWVLANGSDVPAHVVLSVNDEESHLLTLCVHPAHRREGLGRRLLQHVLMEAHKRGARSCFLEVRPSNDAALPLYYKSGFVRVGERRQYYPADLQTRHREDALILSRPLP